VTDHPTLGALLVQHWGLPDEIAQAVRFHHEIERLETLDVYARTRSLVALSVLANVVLVQALAQDTRQWEPSLDHAAAMLHVSPTIARAWAEQASSLL
jgi:HD-like signal output (HDOD) protein